MSTPDQGGSDQEAQDRAMMGVALALAKQALEIGEIPVGSIIVREGRILSQAFNLRESMDDPTAHAERLALTLAGRANGDWRLERCTMYVTLEPCSMCAGAIVRLDSNASFMPHRIAKPEPAGASIAWRMILVSIIGFN